MAVAGSEWLHGRGPPTLDRRCCSCWANRWQAGGGQRHQVVDVGDTACLLQAGGGQRHQGVDIGVTACLLQLKRGARIGPTCTTQRSPLFDHASMARVSSLLAWFVLSRGDLSQTRQSGHNLQKVGGIGDEWKGRRDKIAEGGEEQDGLNRLRR